MGRYRVLMSADTVGGVWTYALELAGALEPYGVEIALATMGGALNRDQRSALKKLRSVEVFESTFKLEWMRDPWAHLQEAGQWLLDLETGTRADLIHLNHFVHGSLPWKAPALVVGHSCVFSWYESVRSSLPGREWDRYRRSVAQGLREADLVTAPTDWMLRQLRKHYGPFITRGAIPNGRSMTVPRTVKKEPLIFSAGRLWDEAKNIQILNHIARRIPWPVYVAGNDTSPEGEAVNFDKVTMLGSLDPEQMSSWQSRAAVFALPAAYEPFGLGALEAGGAGCALVLGDIPSLREIWDGAAVFADPHQPEAFETALNTVIGDVPLRMELGRKARDRALRFSSQRMGRDYWRLYGDLLSSHKAVRRANAAIPALVRLKPHVAPARSAPPLSKKLNIALFCHSLVSDWNNGNAHFLRGVVAELRSRGHAVRVYEPRGGWSLANLLLSEGTTVLERFRARFPLLASTSYDPRTADLDEMLDGVDLVIVHEWNEPELVQRIGRHRRRNNYRLLFHDTHHRAISDPAHIEALDLENFDGVLAFGESLRQVYIERGWARQVWTWHEAADIRVFHPENRTRRQGDLVWIGNWGDDERGEELREFLVGPCRALRLDTCVYGVRYPDAALASLAHAGIGFGGWIPNFEVPGVFSQYRATVHVPRRFYREQLPGIPTIRVFEALACGIPLISAPWRDSENLFTPGEDFLIALTGREMCRHLRLILNDAGAAREIADHGLRTVLARHTCGHRVDELLNIARRLGAGRSRLRTPARPPRTPVLVTAQG